jgi:hypothetical protein
MFISYRNVVLDLPRPAFTIIHRGDLCRYCVLLSLLTLTNDVVDCGVHPGLDADTNGNANCRIRARRSGCATGRCGHQITSEAATAKLDQSQ